MNVQAHIEVVTGGAFGAGSGLVVVATSTQPTELAMAVTTAFICGVAGAAGGYLVKLAARWWMKKKRR